MDERSQGRRAPAGLGLPVVRCLGAAALFAASAPAASKLAGRVPALTLAGLLYLGAGLGVAPGVLQGWRRLRQAQAHAVGAVDAAAQAHGGSPSDGGQRSELDRREWLQLAVAVLAGGAVGPVLLVAGLARTSAATASLLLNTELAATVLFAWLFFREHVGGILLAAVLAITGSGAVLAWSPGAAFDPGALLVVGACLCWGLDNVVTARIEQLTPGQVVLVKGIVAGGANVVLGVVVFGGDGLPSGGSALAAVAIGTAGYGWSITLWVKGARALGAARAQVCFSTAPFIGAALSWTTLGERPTGAQLAAVVVAGGGVALSLLSAHGHPHDHPALLHAHEHRHPDVHHDDAGHHLVADTGMGPGATGRHAHDHRHPGQRHDGPHVPDVHHRHHHGAPDGEAED